MRDNVTSGLRSRILVVDDNQQLARGLTRMLERSSMDAVAVSDAQVGLARLREEEFDAIVCDIRMPGMDGIEFMRAIRESNLDIPIILVTGDPSIDTAQRAVELGAFRYLTKPVDHDELLAVVKRAAFSRRMAALKQRAFQLGGAEVMPGDVMGVSVAFDRCLLNMRMHFQPIVDSRTGEIHGYEALMRPQDELLRHPGLVLEAAERLGRVHELSRHVRSLVVACMEANKPGATYFVNLHPIDLLDPDLVDPSSPMSRHASQIVLEFTERASLDISSETHAVATKLRALGYSIAIDDLGAGYAGLTSFAALEPEVVKIDMNLTRGIDASPLKQRLVGSVVGLCRDLGVKIVAEGIETREERDACAELGCGLLQGYHIARPGEPFPTVNW